MRPKALHTRLLDTLTTAILLVDANMRVSYLNPAAETLLGLSRGRVLRENIARTRVATEYYGFPRTTHLFFGTIPRTTGDFKDLHLCWMDRAESLQRLHELPRHARYPVAIPGA